MVEEENKGVEETSISSESLEELDEEGERENIKKIEAALFVAGRYLSIAELVMLTDVNPILLKKILSDLTDKYKDTGLDVVEQAGKWKMDVASDYRDLVNKLATGQSEFSKAEQESLAIIAYKQPMKQSVLVKIRGNKAYDHVKKFSELGLVNKKRDGRSWELGLSDSFYDYFHLVKGEKLGDFEGG
ncbi:SMC-Scp complex subunit ScpB [Candidatus Pacearchaeota archaeon]|nr:SMC-Scp complex subunit ScpB [Candidatus Pacearchaeota archaeon]|tara:strand:- start:7908 stop:8468 length:561 start_codon:yes stop_codon:yes gene_type:complete